MRDRIEFLIRVMITTLFAIGAAIAILKLGDLNEPAVAPTQIYQPGNGVWAAGLLWWLGSGAAIGFLSAFGALRARLRGAQVSLTTIFLAIVLTASILAGMFLARIDALTFGNFSQLAGIYSAFYLLLTFLPAIVAMLVGNILVNFIDGLFDRRSTLEIMPEELRREHDERQAHERTKPPLERLLHR